MKIDFNKTDDVSEEILKAFLAEYHEEFESFVKNWNGKILMEKLKSGEDIQLNIDVGYPLGTLEIGLQNGEINQVDYKNRDES